MAWYNMHSFFHNLWIGAVDIFARPSQLCRLIQMASNGGWLNWRYLFLLIEPPITPSYAPSTWRASFDKILKEYYRFCWFPVSNCLMYTRYYHIFNISIICLQVYLILMLWQCAKKSFMNPVNTERNRFHKDRTYW